jgi:ribosomal-protein-alanine N-acetyltransferase
MFHKDANPVMLETERLWLREINPAILTALFTTGTDEEITRFLGLPSALELEKEKEKFRQGLTTFNRSFTYFQLLLKPGSRIIGWCGFHTWMLQHRRAEIGYMLHDEQLRNKGLMREAIAAVIAFGFGTMNLNRVEAMAGPANAPSIKLLKHMGFTQEGLMRQHYCKSDTPEDSAVFGLLRSEYEQHKKQ